MIEIQNIRNATIDDVVNLLLEERTQLFEIHIPKSTKLFASLNEDIANDYAMLAFAGQKLNEVADEFLYNYISPSEHYSILFEIRTKDIKQLAGAILFISYGYNNEPEGEKIYYLDQVYDFIEKVEAGIITPVCPDFIEDYQEYNKQSADEKEGY